MSASRSLPANLLAPGQGSIGSEVARRVANLIEDEAVVVRVFGFRGELAGNRALVRRAEVREHGVEDEDNWQGQRRREEGLGRAAVSKNARTGQPQAGRS